VTVNTHIFLFGLSWFTQHDRDCVACGGCRCKGDTYAIPMAMKGLRNVWRY